MTSYHWNGEYWYKCDLSLLRRVLRWIVWIGGWETARTYRLRPFRRRLVPGGLGRERWGIADPTPIAFFGHKFVWFGRWWQLRLRSGWLVYVGGRERRFYLSSNGTPSQAIAWYLGVPKAVVDEVRARRAVEGAK